MADAGDEELATLCLTTIRYYFLSKFGADGEDLAQETFTLTLGAVRKGAIGNPNAYAWGVAHNLERGAIRKAQEQRAQRASLTELRFEPEYDRALDVERLMSKAKLSAKSSKVIRAALTGETFSGRGLERNHRMHAIEKMRQVLRRGEIVSAIIRKRLAL